MRKYVIGSVTAIGIVAAAGVAVWFFVSPKDGDTGGLTGKGKDGNGAEWRRKVALAVEAVKSEAEMRLHKRPEDKSDVPSIHVPYRISDHEVSQAIRVCREARSRGAIPALVQLADAPDDTLGLVPGMSDPPAWTSGSGMPPPYVMYPAASALVAIGEECVPELMEALIEESPSSRRAGMLRHVLADILGPERACKLAAERASLSKDESARKRLVDHSEKLKMVSPNRTLEFKEENR